MPITEEELAKLEPAARARMRAAYGAFDAIEPSIASRYPELSREPLESTIREAEIEQAIDAETPPEIRGDPELLKQVRWPVETPLDEEPGVNVYQRSPTREGANQRGEIPGGEFLESAANVEEEGDRVVNVARRRDPRVSDYVSGRLLE